jgi:hypothetical protein
MASTCRLILLLLLTSLGACRERYGLPLEASQDNILVIEGNILNGDSTRIRLSRTSPIAERKLIAERGASIQIEGEDNSLYRLEEAVPDSGIYKSGILALNPSTRYRLRVVTSGKEYESEWLDVISTPEIDSVHWRRDERDNGVEILVSSRGTGDDTRYFKWDYDEVWEFHANFESQAYFTYLLDARGLKEYQCLDVTREGITYFSCVEPWHYPAIQHRRNDSMYTCWKYVNSNNIIIGSTAALAENVMIKTIRHIEKNAWELSYLYSIQVKQTGLSKDGFEFYKILESNSESLGTIFDAQPSEMKTNIRCLTDAREPVLGFVDATTVQTKRIFISIRQVPDWRYYSYTECTDTLNKSFMTIEEIWAKELIPTTIFETQRVAPYQIFTYGLTYRYCADCRMRGVHRRPEFWP